MPVDEVLSVDVASTIEAVDPAEWNGVVRAAGAPVFYEHAYLSAYEHHPLGRLDGARFLVARQAGEAVAVLPCFLQPVGDPLGVFAGTPVAGRTDPALLGHVWYCYDTRVPAVPLHPQRATAVHDALLDELGRLRAATGAAAAGLVNVAHDDPILATAGRRGWSVLDTDTRYQLPLAGFGDIDDYLMSLPRAPRQNMRRHVRRATEAGVTASLVAPDPGTLAEVCALCRKTAAKFGNGDFYAEEEFIGFVMGLGERALLARVDQGGTLLAGAVALVDERRFHMWVVGFAEATVDGFSPHYVLWSMEIAEAIRRGKQVVEGGRRNGPFKERHGMVPVPLRACLTTA